MTGVDRSAGRRPAGGRAVASPVAVVLLLGMVILGAGAVVAVGSTAIENTGQSTELARAEHSMTLLDSRAAMVGLGETSAQSVSLGGRGDGTYHADPASGRITVTHENATGDGDDVPIYDASLGSVTYSAGDSEVTYQGGGVWRRDGGGTTMVSPPEFHYRDATLTLPVLRVTNRDASSGSVRAFVDRNGTMKRIYPDGKSRRNPVDNGTINVTVQSRYYEGWASYFRTRTTGDVSVDDDTETATVVLKTVGAVGDFVLPSKGESLRVRGKQSDHSALEEFEVDLVKSQGTFNNIYFSFYAREGTKKYETVVRVDPGAGNGGNKCDIKDGTTLSMWVLYENTDTDEGVHAWSNESIPAEDGPVRLVCDGDEAHLVADYDSDDLSLELGESVPDRTGLQWDGDRASNVTFSHPADQDEGGNSTTYATGEDETLGTLTRHYLTLLGPDADLTVYHGPGNRGTAQIDGSESNGSLNYETSTGSQYITYLHLTENNVSVELD